MSQTRLTIRLTPRGGRDAIDGWACYQEGRPYLKVRVSAPPVDGDANAALQKLISKTLRCPNRSVRIVSGEQQRIKHLEIDDIDPIVLKSMFGEPPLTMRL